MSARAVAAVATTALATSLLVASVPGSSSAGGGGRPDAPGAPGGPAVWTDGSKTGFGTARGTDSRVWYTLGHGVATEMFYPRIDTPSVRKSMLLVSDGETFTDREDRDTTHRTRILDRRGLTYRVVNTDKDGDYRITKTYVADPRSDVVLVDVRFESLSGEPYDVYVLHDPALDNDGTDDRGRTVEHALIAEDSGPPLELASVLATEPRLRQTSSGYQGESDGLTDLADDHTLDWRYDAPDEGNVVQVGRTQLNGLAGERRMAMAVGFADSAAQAEGAVVDALARGFNPIAADYAAGWRRYLGTLDARPDSADAWAREWRVSAMVLAASEDKTFRGGFVAAPGRPWAWAFELRDLPVYHAVWSRDQYQIATGLLAAGDEAAANRALTYLWRWQQNDDGSFPQNSDLDGTPIFESLQMDEVAFPIVLAWQLGRTGPGDWGPVRRAARFIVENGPESPQERWENLGNYSPATIGSEIAGLVCAAAIARAHDRRDLAREYLATADQFRADLEAQTATTTGPFSDDPYYLRVSVNGDADAGTDIQVPDGGPLVDERRLVDPSFLELVRLGVVRADDPVIQNSLDVVDEKLRFGTPYGPFWRRSTFDGYGEFRDGSRWEPTDEGSRLTLGRGWPLLSGERGEYRLVAGLGAQASLDAMAQSAMGSTGFMAEQVWDNRPPTGDGPRFAPGEGTFAARPLAWSHAQFLRLARSIDAGRPIETPQLVACRYGSELCRR